MVIFKKICIGIALLLSLAVPAGAVDQEDMRIPIPQEQYEMIIGSSIEGIQFAYLVCSRSGLDSVQCANLFVQRVDEYFIPVEEEDI